MANCVTGCDECGDLRRWNRGLITNEMGDRIFGGKIFQRPQMSNCSVCHCKWPSLPCLLKYIMRVRTPQKVQDACGANNRKSRVTTIWVVSQIDELIFFSFSAFKCRSDLIVIKCVGMVLKEKGSQHRAENCVKSFSSNMASKSTYRMYVRGLYYFQD